MQQTDPPLLVASTDQLGLVPERAAFDAWVSTQAGHPFAGRYTTLMRKAWIAAVAAERELMEPALMTALRHAWEGNHKAAEAYALLAADNLEKRGEANYAKFLRMAVDEMTGRKPAVRVHTNKA